MTLGFKYLYEMRGKMYSNHIILQCIILCSRFGCFQQDLEFSFLISSVNDAHDVRQAQQCSRLYHCTGVLHSLTECTRKSWLFYFWSNSLLRCCGSSRWLLSYLRPCRPHEIPGLSSRLMALVRPGLSCCKHSGKWTTEWKIFLSLSYINLLINVQKKCAFIVIYS